MKTLLESILNGKPIEDPFEIKEHMIRNWITKNLIIARSQQNGIFIYQDDDKTYRVSYRDSRSWVFRPGVKSLNAEGLFQWDTTEFDEFILRGFIGPDLQGFPKGGLGSLQIEDSDIKSLNGVGKVELNYLSLTKLPYLKDLSGLNDIKGLSSIYVSDCPKIESLSGIETRLDNLQRVFVINCPELKELKLPRIPKQIHVENCPQLKLTQKESQYLD